MTDLVKRIRAAAHCVEKGLPCTEVQIVTVLDRAAAEIERLTALTAAPASVVEHNVDDLVAGDAYRDTLLPRADSHAADGSPLWFGWAIMDAFIAGANHARSTPPPPQEPSDERLREILRESLAEIEDDAALSAAVEYAQDFIIKTLRRAKGE